MQSIKENCCTSYKMLLTFFENFVQIRRQIRHLFIFAYRRIRNCKQCSHFCRRLPKKSIIRREFSTVRFPRHFLDSLLLKKKNFFLCSLKCSSRHVSKARQTGCMFWFNVLMADRSESKYVLRNGKDFELKRGFSEMASPNVCYSLTTPLHITYAIFTNPGSLQVAQLLDFIEIKRCNTGSDPFRHFGKDLNTQILWPSFCSSLILPLFSLKTSQKD